MTDLEQGDIYVKASKVDLAIVFGHVGFNEMRFHWKDFSDAIPSLHHVINPFKEIARQPVEWSSGKWLWFVAETDNHGMTDTELKQALDEALAWAAENSLNSVATNGIANTDHGVETAKNRASDELRAAWLQDYSDNAERRYRVSIKLVSLNDIFLRVAKSGPTNSSS